jgi:hypothetical protein
MRPVVERVEDELSQDLRGMRFGVKIIGSGMGRGLEGGRMGGRRGAANESAND